MVIKPRAYETQQLAQRLAKAVEKNETETIEYRELSRVAGCDVTKDGRRYLASARRIVENETHRLFGCDRGTGVKLLEVGEEPYIGTDAVRSLRRKASRTLKRMGNVRYDKLSQQEQVAHNLAAAQIGVMVHVTNTKAVERLTGAVQQSGKLPIGDTLKLFQGNGK